MPQINPFMAFVKYRQQELVTKGVHVTSFAEVVRFAEDEWEALSEAGRLEFQWERPPPPPFWVGPLRTPSGEAITPFSGTHIDAEQQFSPVMNWLRKNDATKMYFVVISCNKFCHISSDPVMYMPSEIGLCVFTLKTGIVDGYWTLIDPVNIPTGKMLEAVENKNCTGIEIPPFEPRFQDMPRILRVIEGFLKNYQSHLLDWTNLFCLPSEAKLIEGCLNWLCCATGKPVGYLKYKIQQLPVLLFHLHRISKDYMKGLGGITRSPIRVVRPGLLPPAKKLKGVKNEAQCMHYLIASSPVHVTRVDIACPYHEMNEPDTAEACAFGNVNNLTYAFLDAICPPFNIPLRRGTHIPLDDPQEQVQTRNRLLIKWGHLPQFLVPPPEDTSEEEQDSKVAVAQDILRYVPLERLVNGIARQPLTMKKPNISGASVNDRGPLTFIS